MPGPAVARPRPAVASLRSATAADHQRVDQRFGRFNLADATDYGRFLTAHALALPGIEAALVGNTALPPLRCRAASVARDLDALGLPVPPASPCARPADDAEAFGMAYVIEGSRFGGALLARSLPAGAPSAYLSAAHQPGEWRDFLLALETAAQDDAWIARATAAASRAFSRYAMAADAV